MSHAIPPQSSLWPILFRIDAELRDAIRVRGCAHCTMRLHVADYRRKPRGGPDLANGGDILTLRHGLCCSASSCRRRAELPSTRFLGRRVYLGIIVVLLSSWRQGPSPPRMRKLTEVFDVDRRTVERWGRWWREGFAASPVWRELRGRLSPSQEPVPLRLVTAFDAAEEPGAQGRLLRALDPLFVRDALGR